MIGCAQVEYLLCFTSGKFFPPLRNAQDDKSLRKYDESQKRALGHPTKKFARFFAPLEAMAEYTRIPTEEPAQEMQVALIILKILFFFNDFGVKALPAGVQAPSGQVFVLVPVSYAPETPVVVQKDQDDDEELFFGLRPRETDVLSWLL